MTRTVVLLAVAVIVLPLSSSPEAYGEQKPGKNRQSEDAARWRAAGDRFAMVLSGNGGDGILFTTEKKAAADGPRGKAFLISKEEAAAIVQVVVDCGLWGRMETSLPGGPIFGRILSIGNGDPRDAKMWILGDRSDDLSSMFIFRHLLKTFEGPRREAVRDWLAHGLDQKSR